MRVLTALAPLVGIAFAACLANPSSDPTAPPRGYSPTDHVADAGAADVTVASSDGSAAATDAATTEASSDAPHEAETAAGDASDAAHADAAGDAGDAGVDAGPAHAFTGAGPYVATLGPSTRQATHNFATNNPPTNPAGQACLACHIAGGAAKEFVMGGTVWKDSAATIPSPGIEVRLRDSAGVAVSAFTDVDGNFYFLKGATGTPTPPALAGIRDATTTKLMGGAIDVANCNNCHKIGGQTPIHL